MEQQHEWTGVGRTALGVAAGRAAEQRRPDPLFSDPWAARFVQAGSGAYTEGFLDFAARQQGAELWRTMEDYLSLRTRFFDDYFRDAAAAGCRQVVLLAAGLDTRAFRLPWPDGTRVFELDRPDVLDFKEGVLTEAPAAVERTVVRADLSEDWTTPLERAGFRAGEPTAWLAEGLMIYLSAEDGERMISLIAALSAPGSLLAVEQLNTAHLDSPELRTVLGSIDQGLAERVADLWQGGIVPDIAGLLAAKGWDISESGLADIASRYGRAVPEKRASSGREFLCASRPAE